MPVKRDEAEERAARIDMILEELRLNTEDLHELATKARERAAQMRSDAVDVREEARRRRARTKPKKS